LEVVRCEQQKVVALPDAVAPAERLVKDGEPLHCNVGPGIAAFGIGDSLIDPGANGGPVGARQMECAGYFRERYAHASPEAEHSSRPTDRLAVPPPRKSVNRGDRSMSWLSHYSTRSCASASSRSSTCMYLCVVEMLACSSSVACKGP